MRFARSVPVVLAVALVPAAALAQSTITGEVTDNTGGILPGVTVEVASPVLIEGSRVAVTDGAGRYTVVALRPGSYTVAMSLPGFSTFIQENIDVPANFTSTVNGQLQVGGLEETVTVSGESPLVDVQQAARVQVLSREVLDNVVNTGTPWTQAMLVPGVSMMGPDVGGSRFVNDLQLEARGADARHTTVMQDGMSLDNIALDGIPVLYNQDLATEEMAVQAGGGGGTAEVQSGGVVLTLIPKEGGNVFSGQGYAGYTAGGWMADNTTPQLKALGVNIGELDQIYDYSKSIGGPIVQDKLWFHNSFRWWGAWTPVPDRLYNDGSVFINEEDIIGNVIRLTAQPTQRNRFSVYLDRLDKRRGPVVPAEYPAFLQPEHKGPDPETAINYHNKGQGWHHAPYWQGQAKWTSTVSSRLLIEAGFTSVGVADCCSDPMPGSVFARGTDEWWQYARKHDVDLDQQWDSVEDFSWYIPRGTYSGTVTYVTGSHNFKTGISHGWGRGETHRFSNGDVQHQQYRSGVPDAVAVRNYPWIQKNQMDYEIGWYAQDAWTIDRMTITAGIRMDWMESSVPRQTVPAGRFVGARDFAPISGVPKWGPDPAPRFGIAYDVFGDATTALKFSVGKYVTPQAMTYATIINPTVLQTVSIPWDDLDLQGLDLSTNGDDIAQDNELDLARLPIGFGEQLLNTLDPDLKREYNIETSLSLERQIMPGVSINVGWYRRSFSNILTRGGNYRRQVFVNRERDIQNDYRGIDVVSPFNGEVFTVYDLKDPAELAFEDNFYTNAPESRRVYNGYEASLNARLPGGGTLITSVTTQRMLTRECDLVDDPNELRFCDRFNLPSLYDPVDFKHDFKVGAYWPLPYEMQISAVFNSVVGRPVADVQRVDELLPIFWDISRNTRYTDCHGVAWCTPGDLVIPDMVESSIVVPLAPAGVARNLPRQNMLNLSFQKIVRTGNLELRPQLEIYNATNASTHYSERSANYGTPTYGIPRQVLLGRMLRLSMQISW